MPDYILHLSISCIIFLILNYKIDYRFAIIITLGIGLYKEFVYDYNYEIADIEADFFGIALGMIINIIWIWKQKN